MKISEVMSSTVISITEDKSVKNAASLMRENNIGAIVVLLSDGTYGITSERDILYKVVAEGKDPNEVKVSEIMTYPVVSVPTEYTVDDVIYLMTVLHIRRILVEEEKELVGVISVRDIIKHKIHEQMSKNTD